MSTGTKPTAPVLNLNGTSPTSLVEEYRDAYGAIRDAILAVQRVTVHGRDFQTAPEGTYEKARAEQVARLEKLQSVADEFMALAQDVQNQESARKRGSHG